MIKKTAAKNVQTFFFQSPKNFFFFIAPKKSLFFQNAVFSDFLQNDKVSGKLFDFLPLWFFIYFIQELR